MAMDCHDQNGIDEDIAVVFPAVGVHHHDSHQSRGKAQKELPKLLVGERTREEIPSD